MRRVELSARGRTCVLTARRLRTALERELAAKLGAERAASLRATLAGALELLGGGEAVRQRRVRAGDAELACASDSPGPSFKAATPRRARA